MKKSILGILMAIIVLSACQKKGKEQENDVDTAIDMVQYVKLAKVDTMQTSPRLNVLGVVTSKTQAAPAFKTGGIVAKTYVEEGDFVKKGQLLATLVMTEIGAHVQQAEEALAMSTRDYERAKNLYADSVATLEQLQNAKTGVAVAKKTLEIAKFNQQHSEVRAPISGRIVQQLLHQGEVAGPGRPVYAILGVSDHDWRVKANLIDKDWVKLKIGDPVSIVFDAYPNQHFAGKVIDKAVMVTDASGSLEVKFGFLTPPPTLAIGMVGRVEITPSGASLFKTIPIESIVKSNGSHATIFVIKNGKAHKKQVQISQLLGEQVAISAGLDDVESVVTVGAIFLEEGDEVEVVSTKKTKHEF